MDAYRARRGALLVALLLTVVLSLLAAAGSGGALRFGLLVVAVLASGTAIGFLRGGRGR